MKRNLCLAVLSVVFAFAVYSEGKVDARSVPLPSQGEPRAADVNYAIGMVLGADLEGLVTDYGNFMAGLIDSIEKRPLRLTEDDALQLIENAYAVFRESRNAKTLAEGEAFLAENALRDGVLTTPSGLQYEILSEGDGKKPLDSDTVLVQYEGKLIDGTVFDSSRYWGESEEFELKRVIPGWTEGICLMNVGSVYRFYIPQNLAYGEREIEGVIPSNSALIFEIELVDIVDKDAVSDKYEDDLYE